MSSWEDLLAAARSVPDKDHLKAALPLGYVLHEELDLALDLEEDGRLVGRCPFHPDERPSFAVFGDMTIAGCWSCNWRGDVFDIIQFSRGCTFPESLVVAQELLDQLAEKHWRPLPGPDDSQDPEEIRRALEAAARQAWLHALPDYHTIRRVVVAKGLMMPAAWLHEEFFIGAMDADTVSLPHLGPARDLTGLKTRSLWTSPIAATGSRFPHLYGFWRLTGFDRVILTEGESDTWTAAWMSRDAHVDVLGLPTGSGSGRRGEAIRDRWLRLLAGKEVLLALDGDDPGREASTIWRAALQAGGGKVREWLPMDGQDVCTAPGLLAQTLEELWG